MKNTDYYTNPPINRIFILKNFIKGAIITLAIFSAPAKAVVIFGGYDQGAGSLASAPTATAAAAFDSSITGLSLNDFESPAAGFSVSGDGFVRSTQRCAEALCGYNTTSGGANFLDVTYNTTFHFNTGIDSFGAYFTGVQRGDATLT